MSTICGIELELLKLVPTSSEVGHLVAAEGSDWQAKFFDDLGRHLHALCRNRDAQISYIAFALLEHEEGKQLIRDLAWWLDNEEKKQIEENAS